MCGIAGIIHSANPRPVDPARVERMCDAIAHRGPDGAGVWTTHGIGLGHRRLSIIDLAGSPQPMTSVDGGATIVFNGEIYNYRALRAELEAHGARFATDGDTEVILAAWQRWGEGCLDRLDGMFAFALHDERRRTTFLARDRFGVKPLYLAQLSDGGLAFASELKALTAHPLLRREVDPLAIEDYLTWGYIPDHRSILKGVSKLAAGHYLLCEQGKPIGDPVRWWDISFADRHRGKPADLEAELQDLMREAVASRMVADVPLGAFLSGGVDSSSVVAMMSAASAGPVTTCSIGFDVAALDETPYARQIAERFRTDHHERVVDPDDFGALDQLVSVFDEPFADASALPTWRVCQLAREHVTVALSGDGADEAFAGYRRQVFHAHEERVRRLIPAPLRGGVLGPLSRIWPKADWAPRPLRVKATLQALAASGAEAYAGALSINRPALRDNLYSGSFQRERGDYRAEAPLIERMENAPARTGLDAAQYADLTFWLPGDILTKVDRTSMAVGLEAREPLLDHRLVEFAARLPDDVRVRGREGKWLLKKGMEGTLPHDILYRPKQGFVTPLAQWFRGPLAAEAQRIGTGGTLARTGWFDTGALSRIASRHIAGREDHARLLWQLLVLEKSLARLGVA